MGVRRRSTNLDVWPEHHAAWDVWIAIQNAWSVVVGLGGAGYLGFDRSAAASVMGMHCIPATDQRKVLDQLVAMEDAALPILNSK